MLRAVCAAFLIGTLGSPGLALAKDAPPRTLSVQRMVSTSCDTDGGPVSCALAVKFLAEAFVFGMNQALQDHPLGCGPGRAETLTLDTLYEYNDGEMTVGPTEEAKKARLAPCVRDKFIPDAQVRLKDLWKKIHELDQRIDVRAFYKMTVVIK